MASPDPPQAPKVEFRALLLLVALATALFLLILWPFFGAVCWSVFIALVFWPLHQHFLRGMEALPEWLRGLLQRFGVDDLDFFFTGELVKGVGLTVWGAVVIGLVDNILRPILVGKDTRLPDCLVLLATLGGLVVFGLNGFVIGPVIAAMFLVSWDMLAGARPQPAVPAPAPSDDA